MNKRYVGQILDSPGDVEIVYKDYCEKKHIVVSIDNGIVQTMPLHEFLIKTRLIYIDEYGEYMTIAQYLNREVERATYNDRHLKKKGEENEDLCNYTRLL